MQIYMILFILGNIIFNRFYEYGYMNGVYNNFVRFVCSINIFIVFNKRDEKSKSMNNHDIIGRWNFPKSKFKKNKKG